MNILKSTIHWFAILRALYFRNLFGPATEKVWPYFRVTYNVLKIYRHWALLLHYPRWGISSQASFPRAEVRLAQTPEQHCSLVSLGWLSPFYLQSFKSLDVKEFYLTPRYLPVVNPSMHLLLVFSHNIWSPAPFFSRYHQAMLISSWFLVSRFWFYVLSSMLNII